MARSLSIVYLLEETRELWGGVQTVLREADALTERGHRVTLLSRTPAPDWHRPRCAFAQVSEFSAFTVPEADLVVGTYCTTVPAAFECGRGRPVHYCQGYEGDDPRHEEVLHLIESIYRLPGVALVAISPFLAATLRRRFGKPVATVPYGIPEGHFAPAPGGPAERPEPFRVGLVGPWSVGWKDLPTGVRAARRARALGVPVELVRVSPYPLEPGEAEALGDLPVERHERVPPERMPALYRSLDLFLGTSNGGAEGFFLPAIEAMASGVPCLLTDIACFRAYDDPADYALFTPPGDAEAMAAGIERLWADAGLRRRLGARGLEVAAKHSFAAHVAGLEEFYLRLVPEGAALAEGGRPWREAMPEALRRARRRRLLLEGLLDELRGAFGEGQLDEAAAGAAAACTLFPEEPDAWTFRGQVERARGRAAAALEACARAAALAPQSPVLAAQHGCALLATGEVLEAARTLARALELGMPGAHTPACLAEALRHLGRPDAASRAAREALRRDPESTEAQAVLAALEEAACAS